MTAFDLQCHSSFSDGVLAPSEVMEQAKRDGMELVALTDHDTIDGVEEARAKATELGMRFSAASEISAVEGRHQDLHVCGYELNVTDPGIVAALDDYRADRQARVEGIADRLEELGFTVDRTVLAERKAAGLPIGRPAHRRRGPAAPREPGAPAGRGHDDQEHLLPGVHRPGREGLRPAHAPERL